MKRSARWIVRKVLMLRIVEISVETMLTLWTVIKLNDKIVESGVFEEFDISTKTIMSLWLTFASKRIAIGTWRKAWATHDAWANQKLKSGEWVYEKVEYGTFEKGVDALVTIKELCFGESG